MHPPFSEKDPNFRTLILFIHMKMKLSIVRTARCKHNELAFQVDVLLICLYCRSYSQGHPEVEIQQDSDLVLQATPGFAVLRARLSVPAPSLHKSSIAKPSQDGS